MRETIVGIVVIALFVIGSAVLQIEDITTSKEGIQITFESGQGYWIENK